VIPTIEFFDAAYQHYARYWHHANRTSVDPLDFPEPWRTLLQRLHGRPPGRALDLGAGEGADAIRLARLGFEVDAVEGSAVGAEKIERFARQDSAHVHVVHADANDFLPRGGYDVIVCSGLLHYLTPPSHRAVLDRLRAALAPDGLVLVATFTDDTPVPECHRILDVYPDAGGRTLASAFRGWEHSHVLVRDKPDTSHPDFPPHRHSYAKLLARRPATG
jgi:cyclopropane fatty-acyl-phospholipid synthase-like methyltransferase